MIRALAAVVAIGVVGFAGLSRGADAPAPPPSREREVVNHLNEMAAWYERVVSAEQGTGSSRDVLFRDAVSHSSRQALDQAFEFARAEAVRLSTAAAVGSQPAGSPGSTSARGQRLAQAAATVEQRTVQLQADLDALDRQIDGAPDAERAALVARRDRLAAELNLSTARRDVLRDLARTGSGGDQSGEGNLPEKIDAIQRSIPGPAGQAGASSIAPSNASSPAAAGIVALPSASVTPPPADAPDSQPTGIMGLVTEMLDLSRRMHELKDLSERAESLRQTADKLRAPLRTDLMNALRRADAIVSASTPLASQPVTQPATQPGPVTQPSQAAAGQDPQAQRRELDALTLHFKQVSAATVPLGRESVLLDQAKTSLLEWRASLSRRYTLVLRSLVVRLGVTAAVVLAIFVVSSLWRRATFRYVHDGRRRRQFMLLRRVVVGSALVIVGVFSFVTEFGSLATFAGILTAGIAVSLQTLILSGVAYFFFVGRFGVRVGDRVTVAGVTGDVIDTGLFRLYLMELGGNRRLDPTGRVVVFSNSVLFQPQGFFKQVPGADYVWHEIALTLAPDSDHRLAEKRLMAAAQAVFADYQEEIDRQHAQARRSGAVPAPPPRPVGRVRFVAAGLEFTLRYPVEIARASEVEDRLTRQLLAAIEEEPKLRLVASGTPVIQAAGD